MTTFTYHGTPSEIIVNRKARRLVPGKPIELDAENQVVARLVAQNLLVAAEKSPSADPARAPKPAEDAAQKATQTTSQIKKRGKS